MRDSTIFAEAFIGLLQSIPTTSSISLDTRSGSAPVALQAPFTRHPSWADRHTCAAWQGASQRVGIDFETVQSINRSECEQTCLAPQCLANLGFFRRICRVSW